MRTRIVGAISILVYLAQPRAVAQQPNLNQPSLDQMMSWLPVDTEAVLGANGPFFWDPNALSDADLPSVPLTAAELGAQSRVFPLTLLNFENGGLSEFIKGKTISSAIEGARRFRPPQALGLMRYEGCLIIVFDPAVLLDGSAFMKAAANSAVRFEELGGTRVALFEEQSEGDTWTTFVGFPRTNVAVIATNLDYLRTLLDRMKGPAKTRALPQALTEWKHVNTSASVWGVRHFQKQGAELDPSSPLQGRNAANIPDISAVGVTFSFGPAAEPTATIDYLSANPAARRILSGHLLVEDTTTPALQEPQMRFRQPAASVLEASINLADTEALSPDFCSD